MCGVLTTITLDIDDNTFDGFVKIIQASVIDDPARFELHIFPGLTGKWLENMLSATFPY